MNQSIPRWMCAVLVCSAGPAAAQTPSAAPPDAETEASAPAPDPTAPDPDAIDPDFLPDGQVAGETIEIVAAPMQPARVSSEQISRDEIDSMPGARGDALETVRSMPGVAFAPAFDGGSADIAIRGNGAVASWFLVDGVQVPNATHFGGLTAILPVEMIDSIELLPGGFDVEYGRATGGVVEIRTRRSTPEAWKAIADFSFVHASAFVQGPLWKDKLSFAASARRSFIDLILPAVLPEDGELSFSRPPRYGDAQLRLDWVPNYRHEVSLVSLYSDDVVEIELDSENAQDPVLTGTIGSADEFWRFIATWRYEGGRFGSRATVAYGGSIEKLKLNATHFLDSRQSELTAREDLRFDVTPWLRLRAGGDVRVLPWDLGVRMPIPPAEGGNNSNFTTDPTIEMDETLTDTELAGYLAADLRPIERLTVTPGVRVDRYDHIDATVVQPRLAAELRLGDTWSTRASVGRFSRPNQLAEAVPDDLKPESAIHLTGGIEQRFAPGVRASVTLFHTWLDDRTVYDPAAMTAAMSDDPLDGYVTRGEGTVRGLELLLRLQRDDLFGWLAYTYARSRRTDGPGMPERAFDYDQPHNLVAAASWRLGKWTLGGRFRFASGLLHTPVVGSVYQADHDFYRPVYGETNSERMEASHQLDLRVDRRFRFDAWSLSAYIDVSNVYANPRVFDYSYDFDYREREPLTDLPILPSIGVRGEF
jgi:outer membrane receptor protein involved in Fe transport